MKKIIAFTALFINGFYAAHAQDTKMNTSPAYDNVHQEHLIQQRTNPTTRPVDEKNNRIIPGNPTTSSESATDLHKLNNRTDPTSHDTPYLRTVSFPKTRKLIY